MAKRKFKQIKNNSEKSSESTNRSNKRSKLSPGTDSDRMIILTQKEVKARLFDKINVRNKEALNQLEFNDDSLEKKFINNRSCSEASDTLFIDTKVSKKKEEIKPRYTTRRYFWESERCYYYLRKCMFLWPFLPPEFFSLIIGSLKAREGTKRWSCLFKALCKLAFGDNSFNLVVRINCLRLYDPQ